MGLGGISIWQLLIVLVIVLLLFGTKRLRNMGSDLGTAFKGFKKAVSDGESEKDKKLADATREENVIEGEATREKDKTDA
ncbi:Sec-independent protein translocase subunit TatA [Thiolapillus sp.]